MSRAIVINLLIGIQWILSMSNAQVETEVNEIKKALAALPQNYGIQMSLKNQHCIFYINDLPAFNSLKHYGWTKADSFTMGHPITAYLENGVNEIKIRAVGDFYKNDEIDQNCELEINAEKGIVLGNILSQIYVEPIKNEDRLTAQNSKQFTERPAIEKNIQERIEDSIYYEGEKDRVISRKLVVQDVPEFLWTKGTPYEDTPGNRKRLVEAYNDLRYIFMRKDYKALEEANRHTYTEIATLANAPFKAYFASLGFEEDMNSKGFKVVDIDYKDYKMVIYNKGRLVQLVDKDETSPILYEVNNAPYTFNPYFSFINGKLIITR